MKAQNQNKNGRQKDLNDFKNSRKIDKKIFSKDLSNQIQLL